MIDKKALIVIDMQNDYLWDKRKTMFSYDTELLVGNVNQTIDLYEAEGYDIIYVKHILSKLLWGVGFSIRGTEGAELFEGVKVVSDYIFEKHYSDSFSAKSFREFIKEKQYCEVAICGLDECGCVGATAKGAVKAGIKVRMLTDCIGRRFPDDKVQRMRNRLKLLGVEFI